MATGYEQADFWAKKAKKEGYPARSVYKLQELDEKFKLLKPGMRVLDIGAAPGSWSMWVARRIGPSGFLAAVDLQPLRIALDPSASFFVQGDIYDQAVRDAIRERGPYNLVLSDAAPATSGNHGLDTDRSEALVEAVLDYADDMLAPGGSVAAKLFMGGGQKALLERLRGAYGSARAFKPKTCRPQSFETYILGLVRKPAQAG
ncbi:MAG: RlmE family RNA methyltransferase [Spirochaetales bacterium]|nr:RlmE family RNA methyltransferase [Spirochaetales bacterium]MBP7264079.1 RlmE family RNA methyltransferase [Spirochaetia bacterium]